MLSPETISVLQSFGYGIAQNLISSAVVEWKKLKDEAKTKENIVWLESVQQAKPLEERMVRTICSALKELQVTKEQVELLLPLASDSVFATELARRILADDYSVVEIARIVRSCLSVPEAFSEGINEFSSSLFRAIQEAIAGDPHLHRIKELQFQSNIMARVAEVKAGTSKIEQRVTESTQIVVDTVKREFQQFISAQKAFSDKTSEPEIREQIYHDRVEQARRLLESGKPKTARRILEELRAETAGQKSSKALLFRIATNIGSCAIQMDDQQTAIKEIDLAFQLEPENPKAITNLSLTTLLKGEPEEALRLAQRARMLLAQDPVATGNLIQALFSLKREAEVEALVIHEEWISKDANCCAVIGMLFFNRGRFADAERFLRLGLAADDSEPRILVYLAHSLIRPIQIGLLGEPVLAWRFPSEAKPRLEEAERLLGRAISLGNESEDRRFFAFSHVLRGDLRRMLGDEAGAIRDCEIAMHEDPSNEAVLPIKALAHFHATQMEQAISTFEKITDPEIKKQALLPWATAYNAGKKPEKVVGLLGPYWETVPRSRDQIKIADQLLWAYSQLGKSVEAEEIARELEAVWPKDSAALAAVAHYRANAGQSENAISLYSEALSYASGPSRDLIALELADIFYQRDEFSKAAELYAGTVDLSTDNELLRRYLVCLYNSGPHKEALRLAQSLRGTGEPIPVISQIEANISAEIGDLKAAQETMERLSQLHPKLHAYGVAAAEFAMRRGRHQDARSLVEQIPYSEVKTAPNICLRVAQLRAVLGMGDVLKFIYEARRAGFDSAQFHAAYVWLFVSREQIDNIDLMKALVDDDCAVVLRIRDERRVYLVRSDGDLRAGHGEITPETARAMDLIGKKKGDRFIFDRDAFGNEVECEVVEVQSKYVRAFQETLERFPALFPKDRTLQGVEGPYEKFRDGLLRQLDEQQAAFQKVARFYEARQATFESLATLLHWSQIELWGALTAGRYCAFANFSGLISDAQVEAETAAKSESILIDLTAILTLEQLGLLGHVAQRFQLFTTQPVLDEFAEAYAKAALSKPALSVGKIGDTYIRHETTPEQLAANKAFLERIIKFLSENVKFLPVPSLLEENGMSEDLRQLLGPVSTASLLAARAERLPLYSEDQMLRSLGRNEWQITGMSAQPVLHELVARGILSQDEHIEATARLFFMNFSVVLISADNLMWTFKKLEYRVTNDTKKILSVFHGPHCTFESAVSVLAEAAKRMWLESPLYHLKMDLLDAILDALGTNRPTDPVAQYFAVAIRTKFLLAPNVADAISERIRLWKERKLGRLGIIVPPRYRKNEFDR